MLCGCVGMTPNALMLSYPLKNEPEGYANVGQTQIIIAWDLGFAAETCKGAHYICDWKGPSNHGPADRRAD